MTDDPHHDEPTTVQEPQPSLEPNADANEISPENAELERRLAEPILRGQQGIETAQIVISAFLITIVGLITFSNAITLPFHSEDHAIVRDNLALHHFATFGDAVKKLPGQPVAMFGLAEQWWFGLDSPTAYHAINVLLHLLNGILVFLLVRRLPRGSLAEPVAMLAGLLFVLHPLMTESVAFVVGRAELMATLFALLSILLFIRYLRSLAPMGGTFLALSLACLVLAWGSSPVVLALPVMALTGSWLAVDGVSLARRRVAHCTYWATMCGLVGLHIAAFLNSDSSSVHAGPWAIRLAALPSHMQWILSPILSPYHPLPTEGTFAGTVAAAIAGAMIVVGLLLALGRSLGGFALLWYGGFLFTAVILAPSTHLMAERNDYLPMAGLVMLVPWVFSMVPRQPGWLRTAAGVAAAVLVVVSAGGTFMRNQSWQSEESLWTDASGKYPDAAEPQKQLGRVNLELGLESYQLAMAAQTGEPAQVEPLRGAAMDRFRAAEEYLKKAIDVAPSDADAWFYMAQAQEYKGDFVAAAATYKETLKRDPERIQALLHLAMATEAQAHTSGEHQLLGTAVQYYARAEKLGQLPDELALRFADGLISLGEFGKAQAILARLNTGGDSNPAKALLDRLQPTLQGLSNLQQQLNASMQMDPVSAESLRLRGQLLALTGRSVQAGYLLESALAKNTQDAAAWIMLGVARADAKASASFVTEWGDSAPAAPDGSSPWLQLARNVAANGQWDIAQAYLDAAKSKGDPGAANPLVALADIAVALNQPARAAQYLQSAAEAAPLDPEPWLRLTDLAIAANDIPTARNAFQKAQQRNASPEALEARRPKLGEFTPQTDTGTVIIR